MLPLANIFQPLIDFFEAIMVFFHDSLGLSWGFSIITLTVVIRAALIPLTLKQFKSMQALQRLQPRMKELQAKYKGDKQRLNEEMMKFYKEHKVNPFGSCLPMVAQIPVFISLFYMLRSDLRMDICGQTAKACGQVSGAHEDPGFLFVHDLTGVAHGGVLVVLIVLYIATTVGSSLLMSVTADKTQRNIMLFLPLIFVAFVIQFPAGVVVYWITTNLWTIAQMYIVRKRVGVFKPEPAAAGAGGGIFGSGGLSGLLGRPTSRHEDDDGSPNGKPDRTPARSGAGKGGAGKSSGGGGRQGASTKGASGSGAAAKGGSTKGASGKGASAKTTAAKTKAGAGAGAGAAGTAAADGGSKSSVGGSGKAPPPPPRKKKKRSGRRR